MPALVCSKSNSKGDDMSKVKTIVIKTTMGDMTLELYPKVYLDLMSLEFKSQVYLSMGRLPSYAAWLLDCDMEPTYRYERRVLQLLQWRGEPARWSQHRQPYGAKITLKIREASR